MKQLAASIFLMTVLVTAQAATEGRILSGNEIDPAAGGELAGEIEVLESVAQGIALSLAICEESAAGCRNIVSEDELAKLIETIDTRLDQLNSFEQTAETAPNYDEILNQYRETREQYAVYMRELQDIGRAAEQELVEEELPPEPEIIEPPQAEPKQTVEKEPPQPKFENEEFDISDFADVDELIRSE